MGNAHTHILVWNQLLNWNQTLIKKIVIGWSSSKIVSGGPAPLTKMAAQLNLMFSIGSYGNFTQKPSYLEPVAQLEPNFDGIIIGWSSSNSVRQLAFPTKMATTVELRCY